jgi:hypothetical protein
LFRHVLKLPVEQQKDIAIRAHWVIMDALKRFAFDPSRDRGSVFESVWHDCKLPAKSDDAQLWEHAKEVFEIGSRVITQSRGSYAELETDVDGFKIRLPWLLLHKIGRKPAIEFLLFAESPEMASKLWRPMLNGLKPKDTCQLTLHSLLDYRNKKFDPSHRISSTKAYIAVQKYRAGDRDPIPGKHCNWCAYSTFCPTYLL